ncbi:hypothetical protein B0T25DRAFT_143792 [Lasiosphaeria hispida]|uniref:Uncharacterized protein n=1 Tax=Lasiosphaeria hispida TaxID=260671 RepID=A0AAJ0MFR4_9PEZI|nr:hypothetical protein B0T25DRAFT_143792 [Lasiosphaeria hispida]
MPDSPTFKKRRLPFKRTAIPFEARRKPRPRWFIQYKRAFERAQQHLEEGDWEPCDLAWAEKCVTHVPAPDGKGILTDSELHRLHLQKRSTARHPVSSECVAGLPALSENTVSPRPAPLQSPCHPPMTSTALRVAPRYAWQAGSAGRSAWQRVTRHLKRQHYPWQDALEVERRRFG